MSLFFGKKILCRIWQNKYFRGGRNYGVLWQSAIAMDRLMFFNVFPNCFEKPRNKMLKSFDKTFHKCHEPTNDVGTINGTKDTA